MKFVICMRLWRLSAGYFGQTILVVNVVLAAQITGAHRGILYDADSSATMSVSS